MSLKQAQGGSSQLGTCAIAEVWELLLEGWSRAAFDQQRVDGAREQIQDLRKHTEHSSLLVGLSPTPLGAVTQE